MSVDPGFWDWKIGDVATWAAAVGSVLAAVAAFRAARDALRISNETAQRESIRFARRAEVNAAHIFTELALVYEFSKFILPLASALASKKLGEDATISHAKRIAELAKEWEALVGRVDIPSLRELPDECAPDTAGAISSVRYVCYLITWMYNEWCKEKNLDNLTKTADEVMKRCYEIQQNFRPYAAYAKRVFNAEIDV